MTKFSSKSIQEQYQYIFSKRHTHKQLITSYIYSFILFFIPHKYRKNHSYDFNLILFISKSSQKQYQSKDHRTQHLD